MLIHLYNGTNRPDEPCVADGRKKNTKLSSSMSKYRLSLRPCRLGRHHRVRFKHSVLSENHDMLGSWELDRQEAHSICIYFFSGSLYVIPRRDLCVPCSAFAIFQMYGCKTFFS